MDKKTFENIISYSIEAPSGDNMQYYNITPGIEYESLILNLPHKEIDFFDYKNIGSQISCGCFLKNLEIAANYYNYTCNIELDSTDDITKIAVVNFIKGVTKLNKENNNLFDAIKIRNCNRFKYSNKKITSTRLDSILNLSNNTVKIHIINKEDTLYESVSNSIYKGEVLKFHLPKLNIDFYKNLRLSKGEYNLKKDGLYHKLLGLPIFLSAILSKFLKYNSIIKILILLGFNKLIAKSTSIDLLKTSQGIVGLSITEKSKVNYIKMGQLAQEIWLNITMEKGSIQPFAPIQFFYNMIMDGKDIDFTDIQKNIIISEYNNIKSALSISQDRELCMVLRFGIPKNNNIKSLRKNISKIMN